MASRHVTGTTIDTGLASIYDPPVRYVRPKIDQQDANANAGYLILIAIAIYAAGFRLALFFDFSGYIVLIALPVLVGIARPHIAKWVIDRNKRGNGA